MSSADASRQNQKVEKT